MNAPKQTVGLALIARDEEELLPNLLASIAGAFDQVALLDTGSTDRTVEVFTEWAAAEKLPLGARVDHFTWCEDFAAARNAAFALLDTEWWCTADCDDEILGAGALRSTVAGLPAQVVAIAAPYFWIPGIPPGVRVRLVRRGAGRWRRRVHEALEVVAQGEGINILEGFAWRHRPERHTEADWRRAHTRNLRILEAWHDDEPDDQEVAGLLQLERAGQAMPGLFAHLRGVAGMAP